MAGVYNMQEMTGTKIYRLLPGGARWNHLVPGDTKCLVDLEMVDMDMMVVPGDASMACELSCLFTVAVLPMSRNQL